jgi:hypothetical protein
MKQLASYQKSSSCETEVSCYDMGPMDNTRVPIANPNTQLKPGHDLTGIHTRREYAGSRRAKLRGRLRRVDHDSPRPYVSHESQKESAPEVRRQSFKLQSFRLLPALYCGSCGLGILLYMGSDSRSGVS